MCRKARQGRVFPMRTYPLPGRGGPRWGL
jgi:hypothetical protein